MKRLLKNSVIVILLIGTAIYLPSCKKEETIPTLPIVTTAYVSEITQTTALTGGTVTDDGGAEITDIGVCWSTSPNPTISSTKTSNGKGTGSFASSITGLTSSTKYYVRAYATNSAGTSYGNEVIFNTNDIIKAPTMPTITTAEVTSITATSAVSGGSLNSDGGGTITGKGVCWGTTANPTVSDSKTNDVLEETDDIISNLVNLAPNTTYYVRAYATNATGTGYGDQVSFITHQIEVATLTTMDVNRIAYTTAESGSSITSNGGVNLIEIGICWGPTVNPTPNDNKMTMSFIQPEVGDFYFLINDLQPSTKYYVRAYAINSVGIGYGNELNFSTFPFGPIIFNPFFTYGSVSDIDGNNYKTIQIGTQLWMAENLKTTKFNDGTVIPNITDNIEWQNLTTPGYSWYNNDAISYKTTFGALYNWYAVSTDKLCPTGWHVPIVSEFKILTDNLGDNFGAKMTETGNNHWLNYITDATNVSGFTGLPGGLREYYGIDATEVNFGGIGYTGAWWSASENGALGSIITLSWDYYINFYQDLANKVFGMSVRCVKD